jgi:hypothetical protein
VYGKSTINTNTTNTTDDVSCPINTFKIMAPQPSSSARKDAESKHAPLKKCSLREQKISNQKAIHQETLSNPKGGTQKLHWKHNAHSKRKESKHRAKASTNLTSKNINEGK